MSTVFLSLNSQGKVRPNLQTKAAIYHSPPSRTISSVEYHILHSTSYRVPVLYFFLYNLPSSMLQRIDTVYEHLVPKHLQFGAKKVGVMGGIGMTVGSLQVLAPASQKIFNPWYNFRTIR